MLQKCFLFCASLAVLPMVFSRMVAGSDVDVAFKDCGSKLVAIEKITANVWPPIQGASLTLTMSGKADSTIDDGTYTQTSYWGGMQVQQLTGKFCDIAKCPLLAGNITIASTADFASGVPAGAYSVTQQTTNAAGVSLYCVTLDFTE